MLQHVVFLTFLALMQSSVATISFEGLPFLDSRLLPLQPSQLVSIRATCSDYQLCMALTIASINLIEYLSMFSIKMKLDSIQAVEILDHGVGTVMMQLRMPPKISSGYYYLSFNITGTRTLKLHTQIFPISGTQSGHKTQPFSNIYQTPKDQIYSKLKMQMPIELDDPYVDVCTMEGYCSNTITPIQRDSWNSLLKREMKLAIVPMINNTIRSIAVKNIIRLHFKLFNEGGIFYSNVALYRAVRFVEYTWPKLEPTQFSIEKLAYSAYFLAARLDRRGKLLPLLTFLTKMPKEDFLLGQELILKSLNYAVSFVVTPDFVSPLLTKSDLDQISNVVEMIQIVALTSQEMNYFTASLQAKVSVTFARHLMAMGKLVFDNELERKCMKFLADLIINRLPSYLIDALGDDIVILRFLVSGMMRAETLNR